MKLSRIARSVPALCLFGTIALAGYGVIEKLFHLLQPQQPPNAAVTHVVPPPFELDQVVRTMAHKHGVKQSYIRSIIAAESAFNQDAISPRGAIGLMQLMPDTAKELGVDPTIAEQNVEGGTKYLGWLLRRYEGRRHALERAIAAYNAGPGNVDRYRGIPPFRETRDYVKRVLTYYKQFEQRRKATPQIARHRRDKTEVAD